MEKHLLTKLKIPQLSVALEPLTMEHAEAFFEQYRDSSIGKLTNLPPLTSINEVQDWIAEETSTANSYNYAVLLPKQSFAGFVNLTVSEHAAFFGIWLGTKYRGKAELSVKSAFMYFFQALGYFSIFTAYFFMHFARHVKILYCK